MSTFTDVITKVETLLRQEAGPSVQQYAEGIIAVMLQDSFDRLFNEYWFPEFYNPAQTYTLTGTNGLIVPGGAYPARWRDIRYIWKAPYVEPLTQAPVTINSNAVFALAPMWQPLITAGPPIQVFRILPLNTTGTVTVAFRVKPANFISTTIMPMETDVMEAEVIYQYLVDDGANELAIKKWEATFKDRSQRLNMQMNRGPHPLAPGRGAPLSVWVSSP